MRNSSQGTADYAITVDFENDIGTHLQRSGTAVNGVGPGRQLRWTTTAQPQPNRGGEPHRGELAGCSVSVIKVVDGQYEFARATPEYAEQANRLCGELKRQLDAAASDLPGLGQRFDGERVWAYLKTHAELSRRTLDRLRRLPPTDQALELLEAFDDWDQYLAQEKELADRTDAEKVVFSAADDPPGTLAWDHITQPAFDAAGGLESYGLTECANTLPSGA